jgi:DnaJ-domain-containing protein 1
MVTIPSDRFAMIFADDVPQALGVVQRGGADLALVAGTAACRALRDAGASLPIVIMDARFIDERVGRAEAERGRANGFVAVPFDRDTFEARVAEALRGGPPPSRPRTPVPSPAAAAPPAARDPWVEFRDRVSQLHRALDRTDYYQLLGIESGAGSAVIKTAYYARAMELHPDRFLTLPDEKLRTQIYEVFKRVSEAFKVLGDPVLRVEYDQGLRADRQRFIRYVRTERPRQGPKDPTSIAATADGRKYVGLALLAERQGNWSAAQMHLSLAVQAEPGNKALKARLQEIRAKTGKK